MHYEPEPLDNALQPGGNPPVAFARRDGHEQQAGNHGDIARAVGEEAPAFADGRHGHAGDGRAEDAGAIEHGGIQGDGIDQIFPVHHLDDKRLAGRDVESVHHAEQRGQQHDLPDLDVFEQRQRGKDERQQHGRRLRGDDDAMSAVTVREHAPHRRQQKDRDLPRKAYQPEQQRRPREPVDEPRLRDRLHPGADHRDDLAAEEQPVVAVPQRAKHHGQPRCVFSWLIFDAQGRRPPSMSTNNVPQTRTIITFRGA